MSSTVQGYVRRAHETRALANARVKLTYLGGDDHRQLTRSAQVTATDHDGWFSFRDLDAGSYWVATDGATAQEISVDDFTSVTLELWVTSEGPTPAPAQEPTIEPTQDLPRVTTASIKGRVISASSGFAVSNASVILLSGPASAPDIAPLTGTTGEFTFYGLAAGAWTLRAIAPDGASKQLRVDVRADDTASVTIAVGSDGDDCRCAR